MATKPSAQPRSPLRRILPRLLIGTPILVLLVIGSMWLLSGSSLETKLDELRTAGQPTTAAEINDFYIIPEGVNDTTDLWVAAIDGVAAAEPVLSSQSKDLPIIGNSELTIPPPGEAWAEFDASRSLLRELESELQAIWIAAGADGQARYPVDFSAGINTQLPHLQSAREVARILALDSHVATHDNDNARALRDVQAIFALSDSLRAEPCLITQLVRIAIHAIGREQIEKLLPYSEWNDTQLHSLQRTLQVANFKQEIRLSLSGERAMCVSALDTVPMGPFRKSNKLEALRLFETSIEGLDGTWAEAIAEQRQVSGQLKSMASNWFSKLRMMGVLMIMPAHEQVTLAAARAEATQRTAIIAIAAHRHRLKHGELPMSPAEIDPEILDASVLSLSTDPFNGKPLKYKVDGSGVTIYSVGENEQDDGGKVDTDETSHELLDVGFKLQR